MPVKLEQVRYISNVFGHVYKWVGWFFFLHIYLMHWSDPCRCPCCLDSQYVVDTGQLLFFFSFLIFLYVHKMCLFIPALLDNRVSCLYTHSAYVHVFHFESICNHQIHL